VVYSTMTPALIPVIQGFGLGRLLALRHANTGFAGQSWVVETERGRYVLKRRGWGSDSPRIVLAQHRLMDHLVQSGFPAPRLVPSAAAETLLVHNGLCYEAQAYIDGVPYNPDRPQQMARAAETLARYHSLVEGVAPAVLCAAGDRYSPASARRNLAQLNRSWAMADDRKLAPAVGRLMAQIEDLEARSVAHQPLPRIVIHGDYYAGNLLFDGDRVVGVLDFDLASWQPRVVDLAEALIYFAAPDSGPLRHVVYCGALDWGRFARFLRHYTSLLIPEEAEIQALPDMIQCIWMQMCLQRLLERYPRRPTAAVEILSEVQWLGTWAAEHAIQLRERAQTILWSHYD
jgi:homoserine kinase type II